MRGKLLGCCAAAAMTLSGCGSGQLARPQAPEPLAPATEVEAATVTLTCTPAGEVGAMAVPLLGAVAAIGVDFTVDLVSKLLKDAQAKRNAAWSAAGVADNCIPQSVGGQVAGALTLRRAVLDATGAPRLSPGFDLDGTITFTRVAGTDDKGQPADTVELSFGPTTLAYGRTAAPIRGSGRKHVVVLLAFSSTSPLKNKPVTGDEELPSALRLDLGTMRDGRSYATPLLSHVKGMTTIPAGAPGRKLLVTAIVVESEDELIALKALTDAYDGNKDDLTAALRAALGIKDE